MTLQFYIIIIVSSFFIIFLWSLAQCCTKYCYSFAKYFRVNYYYSQIVKLVFPRCYN